jgi:hypothetical protein
MTHGSDGKVWIRDELQVGTGTSLVTIGYLKKTKEDTSKNLEIIYDQSQTELAATHQVINASNKFIVHEDGSMVANDGVFRGTIYATGGKIGNMEIEALVDIGYEVSIEIKENTGTIFETDGETKTLIAVLYKDGKPVSAGITGYQWYENNQIIPNATGSELVINENDIASSTEFSCRITKE